MVVERDLVRQARLVGLSRAALRQDLFAITLQPLPAGLMVKSIVS
jgi:hypothetical protein